MKGGARAEQDAGQQIAAELVGAEPMRPARRLGHRREIVGGRVVGREHVGEDAGEPEHQHQDDADRADRLAAQEIPDDRERAARRQRARRAAPETPVGVGEATVIAVVSYASQRQARRMRGSSQA